VSRQHRDAVSGLAFRHGTHELFSASFDRTVKLWNVGENGIIYVETLFGHQDVITAIDALSLERCVTSGARDGSVRVWKIVDESQLVFHGHSGSIDCVCYVDDNHFFSGADDGSLALWSTFKKKPLVTVCKAHSGEIVAAPMDSSMAEMETDDNEALPTSLPSSNDPNMANGCVAVGCVADGLLSNPNDALTMKKENWVTAVAALHNSDLVVSGSKDGLLRFWKCGNDYKTLTHLFALPMVGFINSLQFSSNGQLLVAGLGQEHKLGRWWHVNSAKNAVCIVRLNKQTKSRKTVI
jgi:ribosomal RNA-processing protein 9